MYKYNSHKSNITTGTPQVEEVEYQITEQDQSEIKQLILTLKQRENTDRDLFKLIDCCEHLLCYSASLSQRFTSLINAHNVQKGELLNCSLTIQSLQEQLSITSANTKQMEGSLVSLEQTLDSQVSLNHSLVKQLANANEEIQAINFLCEQRELQHIQQCKEFQERIKQVQLSELERVENSSISEILSMNHANEELQNEIYKLKLEVEKIKILEDEMSTGTNSFDEVQELAKPKLKVVIPPLQIQTQSTFNEDPQTLNSPQSQSESSDQGNYRPLSLLDEDFNIAGLKSHRESTFRKYYLTSNRQSERNSPGQELELSPNTTLKLFDNLASIVLSKEQLRQTLSKTKRYDDEWL